MPVEPPEIRPPALFKMPTIAGAEPVLAGVKVAAVPTDESSPRKIPLAVPMMDPELMTPPATLECSPTRRPVVALTPSAVPAKLPIVAMALLVIAPVRSELDRIMIPASVPVIAPELVIPPVESVSTKAIPAASASSPEIRAPITPVFVFTTSPMNWLELAAIAAAELPEV